VLGIIVSLPWELRSLTREKIEVGECRAIADNTLVAVSGMGAERAYTAGSVLVSKGITALLSWGCAAALDDGLNAGMLLLPEQIIGASGEIYHADAEWHNRLYQTLQSKVRVRTDALVESNTIVKTSAEKRALAKRAQAAATDMESAAQARLAEKSRLRFVAIRAIVDTTSTEIPSSVFQALGAQGHVNLWKLLTNACLRPADWIMILQLGIQFNGAQRTLKKTRKLVLDSPRF
jgi:adenosylhomocysteine nucleosidase